MKNVAERFLDVVVFKRGTAVAWRYNNPDRLWDGRCVLCNLDMDRVAMSDHFQEHVRKGICSAPNIGAAWAAWVLGQTDLAIELFASEHLTYAERTQLVNLKENPHHGS